MFTTKDCVIAGPIFRHRDQGARTVQGGDLHQAVQEIASLPTKPRMVPVQARSRCIAIEVRRIS